MAFDIKEEVNTVINVVCADVLDWCAEYDGPKFHALLADAPYELSFMNRKWDGTGVSYQPETWAALAEHLHPGAFLMVFGGARSWHRLAVAMEDASLIIHPTIFCWAQGSGFPKATRIDTQIDKAAGKLGERRVIGCNPNARPNSGRTGGIMGEARGRVFNTELTSPVTDLARAWQGHRYGLQALKPAVEPIIVAQKPYSGKPVDSIVETGAGALWIDGGRVATGDDTGRPKGPDGICYGHYEQIVTEGHKQGRWPPNFALCHIPSHKICQSCQAVHPIQPAIEVCDCGGELEFVEGCRRVGVKKVRGNTNSGETYSFGEKGIYGTGERKELEHHADPDGKETVDDWECAEGCPARRLGEQSGESKSIRSMRGERADIRGDNYGRTGGKTLPGSNSMRGYEDKGTAARYFPQADWEHEEMECSPDCPIAKLDEQAGERPTGNVDKRKRQHKRYDSVFPKRTYDGPIDYVREGNSGGASRFYPNADWTHEVAEQLAQADPVHYCPKSPKKERNNGLDDFYWRRDKKSPTGFVRISQEKWEMLDKKQRARGNCHSTVKPLGLLKWLATLLLPPKEYAPRRILVPFSGSLSEAIAAVLAGWEEVEAVELLQDYCNIGEARAAFWLTRQLELSIM